LAISRIIVDLDFASQKLEVLNPLPDSPLNYDYGYTRRRPVTHARNKARGGAPYFRELTDTPHSFTLNWTDRSLDDITALKRFYEQYRDGVFILIDHEGGGREYVGRFTTPVEPVPTRNASWSVQYVQFEEFPTVPMRNYPQRWDKDAVWVHPLDFKGNARPALFGSWTLEADIHALTGYDFISPNAQPSEWAQVQYVGYGFQFWARTGPDLGKLTLELDGSQLSYLDLYAPIATKSRALYTYPSVPYGMHRVKLLTSGTQNASSTGASVVWDSLKVMR
jgi:hypothetical protein